MIVVDASALVEALIGRDVGDDLLAALSGDIAAPHHLDVEVLSVLRGLLLGGKLTSASADSARRDLGDLLIDRYDVLPLADRMWALRDRYTCYDAAYLALAEALDAPLHTCDAKLAGGGHKATVVVHGRGR